MPLLQNRKKIQGKRFIISRFRLLRAFCRLIRKDIADHGSKASEYWTVSKSLDPWDAELKNITSRKCQCLFQNQDLHLKGTFLDHVKSFSIHQPVHIRVANECILMAIADVFSGLLVGWA